MHIWHLIFCLMWPLKYGHSSGFGGNAAMGNLNDFLVHSAPALSPQLLSIFCLCWVLAFRSSRTTQVTYLQYHTTFVFMVTATTTTMTTTKTLQSRETWLNQPPDLCLAGVTHTEGCISVNLCSGLVLSLGALVLTSSLYLSIPPSLPCFLLTLA